MNDLRGKSVESYILEKHGKNFKQLLTTMYWDEGKSQRQIAKELGLSTGCVCINFKKYNIKQHPRGYFQIGWQMSEEHKKKISKIHKGKTLSKEHKEKLSKFKTGKSMIGKNPKWTGKRHRSDGYIQLRTLNHPLACKEGYVMEHRIVMEKHLGRYLTEKESVHHINHVRNDNRIENLHLFASNEDHQYFHMMERHGNKVELQYEYEGKGSWKN